MHAITSLPVVNFGDKRLPERFWSKVNYCADGCWEWSASLKPSGYGQFRLGGKTTYPHRVAYDALVGAIPPGLCIDHLCRNRVCCNPAHLEPVTQAENVNRGLARGQTWSRGRHYNQGELCASSKLTSEQVIEIRKRYMAGGVLQRELAAEFGVKKGTISAIIVRKTWFHLDAIQAELERR